MASTVIVPVCFISEVSTKIALKYFSEIVACTEVHRDLQSAPIARVRIADVRFFEHTKSLDLCMFTRFSKHVFVNYAMDHI